MIASDSVPEPLHGIRVVELSQGIAAPSCARYLSAHGAEVIKVESPTKPDITRLYSASWLPEEVDPGVRPDSSPLVDEFISGKKSFGLNIASEEGHALLLSLVTLADVFLVNLSTHAVRSLRLTYEELRAVNQEILYMTLPGFGNTPSRYAEYRAWGPNQAPLAGIDHLTGWPDRPPSGISAFAYPDYVNANHATVAILAALLERDVTGAGQFIDMSQFESTVSALGPTIMDYTANGRDPTRTGNRSARDAPHGVYPSRGRDRWVAIACRNDDEWRALCGLAAGREWASDERWSAVERRLQGADELDDLIAAWTAEHTARELAYRLQEAGVPAGMVQDIPALLLDPQLEARRFFTVDDRRRFGVGMYMSYPPRMTRTPAEVRGAGACLGEHNEYVLASLLGVGPQERARLVEAGVVYEMPAPDQHLRRPYLEWVPYLYPTEEWER